MPYIWLEPEELRALQDVFDWEHRVGHQLDWIAFDRARARIIALVVVPGSRSGPPTPPAGSLGNAGT